MVGMRGATSSSRSFEAQGKRKEKGGNIKDRGKRVKRWQTGKEMVHGPRVAGGSMAVLTIRGGRR